MSDRDVLSGYVETWWQAIGDLTALLDDLSDDEWALPTDLPGWDVKACASHTAHLESVLAGNPEESAEVGEPSHIVSPMGLYTEIGVINRRDTAPQEIVAEIRAAAEQRYAALRADPPEDPDGSPDVTPGAIGWNWRTLLRNRPLDVWMHEQDVRRAVGRPGGMDSAAAQHTADYLSEGFGFVVGKRVRPPVGTTAVLAVAGSPEIAVEVGADGRAARLPATPAAPVVRLDVDRANFVVLAGGRRAPEPGSVRITGDDALGQEIVANLGTTP
jgi:uncharacterized protein (TIGR03083 family)